MSSFRTGLKIFGELSIKQGFGRIRSFSEDRKPGQWLPEDQWAVRKPGSTCPDPSDKPKKPAKPSKSWLSICKDPEPPIVCDIRHNNCPSPPVKEEGPWYSLDNLMPKKKSEKIPPHRNCREEMKRREQSGEKEEVCENIVDRTLTIHIKPEHPENCMPKQEPCPAPVVTLSCPLPKELDLMLWCNKPAKMCNRIPIKCQSDILPYQEFRPQKIWKPSPFSLPIKPDPAPFQTACANISSIPYSEFKQVEVPKPLYTRYKSVELSDSNFLFCMTNASCSDEIVPTRMAIKPPDPRPLEPCVEKNITEACTEKPFLEAASRKPIRLKKAPKYTFTPKPTKLIEKRVFKNPCAHHKACSSPFQSADNSDDKPSYRCSDGEPPKVFTGTLTNEPQVFERSFPACSKPPSWMYFLCKPGSTDTPLVPKKDEFPKEPDWCSETDGLKFYDDNNGNITPKPPPDPYIMKQNEPKVPTQAQGDEETPCDLTSVEDNSESYPEFRNRFVLMPENFNIKYTRVEDPCLAKNECESASFEQFIEAKTAPMKKCSKSYPPMKENILYDLQRLSPNAPFDPSKINAPRRKPPLEPECPQLPRFGRNYSTFSSSALKNLQPLQLCSIPRRTECGDSSKKCKVTTLQPKPKECPEPAKQADCAEMTLPCCPKARIPPECNIRRPMPPCKKKLAPKPSFSECSKDPPPCPRITECNCWEKKPGKNKK